MSESQNNRGVVQSFVTDARRLREIGAVFTRHGFAEILRVSGLDSKFGVSAREQADVEVLDDRTVATRARRVLEDLGPTFIKLGQILSTRPDMLPAVFVQELRKLQDAAPPVEFEAIRAQLEDAFGRPHEEVFAMFEPEPLASASIAQVHRAELVDGTEVAVKVQRPGIEPQIRSDLALMYYIARLGEATIEEAGIYNPVALIREFERAITEELNFLVEADSTERARLNCAEDERIVIPRIIPELTAPRVMTMTFVRGRSLHSIEPGSERGKKLATIAMEGAFDQIFEHGFFHGDPHPGNMLVTDDDRVVFLDWGLVGRLSGAQQDQLIDLIIAIITSDLDGVTRIVLRMGRPEGRVNLRQLRADIQQVRDGYLTGALGEIDVSALMSDIMEISHRHHIRVNPEYALLTKAFGTVDGILRVVYPDLDIIPTLRPYAERLIRDRYSGHRLTTAAVNSVMTLNHVLRDVPMQVEQMLMDVEGGELQVHVRHPALDTYSSSIKVLGSRVFMGFVAGGLIVGGSILLATESWVVRGVPVLPVVAGFFFLSAAFFAFAALSWHFVAGGWRKLRLSPWVRLLRRK